MPKSLFFITFMVMLRSACAQELTAQEQRWLEAGDAVITYARDAGLPLDIIVQPKPHPGAVPLALGFSGGRCKLVFSMRGNTQAEAILQEVPEQQRGWMIEAMMAHELGHCWRYAQGNWHRPPSGFVEPALPLPNAPAAAADKALAGLATELRETRREEGYADLAALAWIGQRRPAAYGAVYGWMRQVRSGQSPAGTQDLGSHDTLAWLRLAPDGASFDPRQAPFEQAFSLWAEGLRATGP